MASSKTDNRERVGVAEGVEPTTADVDTGETEAVEQPAPRSLKQRMAAIRDECAGIGKQDIEMQNQDRSKKWTIKGHTFEAVLSEIRPLFAKHGVDMTPNLIERTYAGNRCDVIVDFTFERTDDSDEQRVIRWAGAGTDNGDKAFAKAGTNAVKEMLKKRFLVTDRDDAKEEEEKVEHQTEEGLNRAELEKQKDAKRRMTAQWASAFRAALLSAEDLAAVKALERENREQLTDEDLPTVTRTFFIDLIQTQKNKFSGKGGGAAEEAFANAE